MNEENNTTSTTDDTQITGTTAAEGDSQTTGQGESEVQTEGNQPAEGQQGEETFYDPSQLPEELKPAYKSMQAAFTKKTQSLAEERKLAADYKAKAEAYAKYEPYAPILEEMLKGQPNKPTDTPELKALTEKLKAEGYSEDAIKMMTMSSEFLLNSFNQKQEAEKTRIETEKETARIQTGIDESAKVDPRLNDASLVYQTDTGESITFGGIVENLVLADPKWRQDPIAATKRAIARVDALIGKAKTQGKEELSNSARQKAKNFAPNGSSPQSTVSTDQPMTIKEAAAQAKKQLGI